MKPLLVLVLLPAVAVAGIIIWLLSVNSNAATGAALQVPPFDLERIPARLEMTGGSHLDPLPAAIQPKLSGSDAAKIAFEYIRKRGLPTRLDVKLGVNRTPFASIASDRTVYVIVGDNLIDCLTTGALPRSGSAVPRTGPAGSAFPRQQAAVPSLAPQFQCAWSLTIDAQTGEALRLSFGPDIFCRPNRLGPPC